MPSSAVVRATGVDLVAETWAVWPRSGATEMVDNVVEALADLLASAETMSTREKASFLGEKQLVLDVGAELQ
jgi:hypothetical protein